MKKLQPKFSNFNYRIVESTLDYHHEVEVTFDYGKTQAKRILYIPTLEDQPDAYYIERAKEKIAEEIENGSLIKYTTKNFGNRPSSKTALKAAVWVLAIATIASTGFLVYRFLPFNNRHRITFVTNGGTDIPSQYVVDGERLNKPTNPTREDCEFRSWYLDKDFSTEYVFDNPVKRDLVLFAKWGDLYTYAVTVNDATGGVEYETEVTHGTKWSEVKNKIATEVQTIKQDTNWMVRDITDMDNQEIDDNFVIKENLIVKPQWDVKIRFEEPTSSITGYEFRDHFKLTHKGEFTFDADTKWGEYVNDFKPRPLSNNYVCDGFVIRSGASIIDENSKMSEHAGRTFYPVYSTKWISFKNDPWQVFVNSIRNGAWFSKPLGQWAPGDPYYEEYHNNGDTFVGLERRVNYNNSVYNVRVIGEDRDAQPHWEKALTFEFEEVVGVSIYNHKEESTITNIYGGSVIENYLNDTVFNGLATSEPDLHAAIYATPGGIEPTKKIYFDQSAPDGEQFKETSNFLFLLSGSEITDDSETTYPVDGDEGTPTLIHEEEGDHYGYYEEAADVKAARVKYLDRDHEIPVPYWLRSPKEGNGECAWAVNVDGSIGIPEIDEEGNTYYSVDIEQTGYDVYVAPAFMI